MKYQQFQAPNNYCRINYFDYFMMGFTQQVHVAQFELGLE
jgi:hypothetical protein